MGSCPQESLACFPAESRTERPPPGYKCCVRSAAARCLAGIHNLARAMKSPTATAAFPKLLRRSQWPARSATPGRSWKFCCTCTTTGSWVTRLKPGFSASTPVVSGNQVHKRVQARQLRSAVVRFSAVPRVGQRDPGIGDGGAGGISHRSGDRTISGLALDEYAG